MSNPNDDITPRAILRLHREHASAFVAGQAEMFREMNPADRQELLFYMTASIGAQIRQLHMMIDPKNVQTLSVAEFENTLKKPN